MQRSPDIATDGEMLEAVELWASARGFDLDNTAGGPTWRVGVWGNSVSVETPDRGFWMVSPRAALVWALTEEMLGSCTGQHTIDVGMCKACIERGGGFEWCQRVYIAGTIAYREWRDPMHDAATGRAHLAREGWELRDFSHHRAGGTLIHAVRSCPACSLQRQPTGRDRREVGRLILDAMPRPRGNPQVYQWTEPGDPTSIEALHVLADQLQSRVCHACNRPAVSVACQACGQLTVDNQLAYLGLALAHLLVDSRDGTADVVAALRRATPEKRLRDGPDARAEPRPGPAGG